MSDLTERTLKEGYDIQTRQRDRIRDLEAALRFCQFYMRDVKFPTDHPMALAISKALTAPETLPEFDPAWVCGVCGKRHGPGQCLGVETEVQQKCPDALLPDGPVCPRCGQRRGPSGIDGGSWVHY